MKKTKFIIMLALSISCIVNHSALADTTAPAALNSNSQYIQQEQQNQQKINELNKEIDSVLKDINKNKQDMINISKLINLNKKELSDLEKNSQNALGIAKKRIRAMYETGSYGYLNVILGSKNFDDFISRLDTISSILCFDKKVLLKLDVEKKSVLKEKEKLDSDNKELLAVKKTNESKIDTLNKAILQCNTLLKTNTSVPEINYDQFTDTNLSDTLSRGQSMIDTSSISSTVDVVATAYAGDTITAMGTPTVRNLNGYSTIAVDPRVIPLGSKVYVEGYGYALAVDTGGDIKGNRIDLFMLSENEAMTWGRQPVKVYILK